MSERVARISRSLCAVRADTPDMIHDISDVLINRAFRRQQQTCDYREFEKRWRRARRSRRVQRLTTQEKRLRALALLLQHGVFSRETTKVCVVSADCPWVVVE